MLTGAIVPTLWLSMIFTETLARRLPWWGWVLLGLLLIFLVWIVVSQVGLGRSRRRPPSTLQPGEGMRETHIPPLAGVPEPEPDHEQPAGSLNPVEPLGEASPSPIEPFTPSAQDSQPGPEDLKQIVGIGPGTASVLNAAGVKTFAQLAGIRPEQLEQILRSAGMRATCYESWPEQARLAAAGQWDELHKMQKKINK